MKRFSWSVMVLTSALLSAVLWQSGCGDPLVGLECAKGYVICNGQCVDLSSDELSCGSCGAVCAIDEMCINSECTHDFDSGRPPAADSGIDGGGGTGDGGLDGGPDGGLDGGNRDGGDSATEGWADVELPPICMGAGSPSDCVCDLGELICEANCINAAVDTFNCGACGKNCNAIPPANGRFFCVDGACQLNCDPPLSVCNNSECVDLQTDPNNCGSCGFVCDSGLCDLGQCLDRVAGHVIVIGHDMSVALPAARRLAGNAMFMPSKSLQINALMYEVGSTPSARAGVANAISDTAAVTGRQFVRTEASDVDQVSFQLSFADVFVITAQANATDQQLMDAGDKWARAMQTFVARGGVIVLYDGDAGGGNNGTYQILQEAGMFTATQRVALSPRTVNVEAPNDAIARFVPAVYQAQNFSVGFDTAETTVVVRDRMTGFPVVVHIAR